jgi:TonB family protein
MNKLALKALHKTILLLIMCFSYQLLIAQNKIFCDEDGFKVDSIGAKYFKYADNGSNKIYYLNGNTFQISNNIAEKILVKQYFPNQKLKYKGYFDEEKQAYVHETWYENGQQEKIWTYEKDFGKKMLQVWDSLGTHLIKDGYGLFTSFFQNKQKHEEGKYNNGFKIEGWKGWFEDGKLYYDELWENGKLVNGISYNKEGQKFEYEQEYVSPEAKGGMLAFYQFVGQKIKYPKAARRNGIEGRVMLRMMVDEVGNLNNIFVMKGIGAGCDEECIRVVKAYPNWTPGKHKGQVFQTRLEFPIAFKLD